MADFTNSQKGQIKSSLNVMFNKQTETLGVAFQNLLNKFEKLEIQVAKNDQTLKKLDESYGRLKIVIVFNLIGDRNKEWRSRSKLLQAPTAENFSIRGRVLYWKVKSFEINKGGEFAEIKNLERSKEEIDFVKNVNVSRMGQGVKGLSAENQGNVFLPSVQILRTPPHNVTRRIKKYVKNKVRDYKDCSIVFIDLV
ncbi:hypothetical protein CHUAL_009522 [Chamberlinius hualienensis]